jgi:hypothetical protein
MLLNEKEINIPLHNIGLINISFYKTNNELLNIFNLEHDFNEDIIPLITSYFEQAPKILHKKIYYGLEKITYINTNKFGYDKNQKEKQKENQNQNQKEKETNYPSFYIDIEKYKQNININIFNKCLLSSYSVPDYKYLIRIYSRRTDTSISKCDFLQEVYHQNVVDVITWSWLWGTFEITINEKKKCTYQLLINVIEDNKFIENKIKQINDILKKLNKIKSAININ